MDLPNYDNAMKWQKALSQLPWLVRLLLIGLVLILGGVYWWFGRSKPGTGNVAIHQSDLKGSPVNPQYTAGHDMAVYNVGSIDKVVIGARLEASIFKTVSDPLRKTVHDNLDRVRGKFAPPLPLVTISADNGNQNRVKISDEMGDFLRASGFEVKVPASQLFSQSREPIKAIFRPRDKQLVKELLMAFEPVLHATVGAQEVANRPGDEIVFLILGEPKFTPEGIIVFE